jgi:peptide-methionine (R)-S-oxide reductase
MTEEPWAGQPIAALVRTLGMGDEMGMMHRRAFLGVAVLFPVLFPVLLPGASCASRAAEPADNVPPRRFKVEKPDQEWRKILSPEQYDVLRNKGTERAFTGRWWNEHRKGIYRCAGCQTPLFSSETKFESGTGWPSYFKPIDEAAVLEVRDVSHGLERTEVLCATCGGHLGHVFDDGPRPTGLRYCMNSAALHFEPEVAPDSQPAAAAGPKQTP